MPVVVVVVVVVVGFAAILQSTQFKGVEVLHNRESVNGSNIRLGTD